MCRVCWESFPKGEWHSDDGGMTFVTVPPESRCRSFAVLDMKITVTKNVKHARDAEFRPKALEQFAKEMGAHVLHRVSDRVMVNKLYHDGDPAIFKFYEGKPSRAADWNADTGKDSIRLIYVELTREAYKLWDGTRVWIYR